MTETLQELLDEFDDEDIYSSFGQQSFSLHNRDFSLQVIFEGCFESGENQLKQSMMEMINSGNRKLIDLGVLMSMSEAVVAQIGDEYKEFKEYENL